MVFTNDLGAKANNENFFIEKEFKNIHNLWHIQIAPNESRVVIELFEVNSYLIFKMHELKFISIINHVAFLQIGNSRIQIELSSEIQKNLQEISMLAAMKKVTPFLFISKSKQ